MQNETNPNPTPSHPRTGRRRPALAALACALSLACGFGSACAAPETIRPGEIWPDDRGKHVQAHGGGIIKQGDTWYWFGEDRSEDNDPRFRYVACYSSTDLAHWTFRNQVVKAEDPAGLGEGWVLERPKVFPDPKRGRFVLYAHMDDKKYKAARVGVFTCDTVDGDYKFVTSFRPMGNESRDIGQFIDDDGAAYLISEDRPKGFHIYRLSEDLLSVEKDVHLFPKTSGGNLEGGAVVHYDGLYYVVGSQLTGWQPNANKFATATRLEGPWSAFADIAPPEKRTYLSQSTMLLKVGGSETTTVLFLADWWTHKDHPLVLSDARYVWMPAEIGNGRFWVPEPKPFTLDVATGKVGTP